MHGCMASFMVIWLIVVIVWCHIQLYVKMKLEIKIIQYNIEYLYCHCTSTIVSAQVQ